MGYTQVRITTEYHAKLKALSERERRSMAQQIEYLIDYYERLLKGQNSTEDIDQILATLTEDAQ